MVKRSNIYDSPHYVPVNTDIIDKIEINMKNDLNENVLFKTVKVICKYTFDKIHYEDICT